MQFGEQFDWSRDWIVDARNRVRSGALKPPSLMYIPTYLSYCWKSDIFKLGFKGIGYNLYSEIALEIT